MVWLVIRVKS